MVRFILMVIVSYLIFRILDWIVKTYTKKKKSYTDIKAESFGKQKIKKEDIVEAEFEEIVQDKENNS